MANQTELLNVSDEMKLDDVRQELCELESDEELCFSSLDTTEGLYSSSIPDTCGGYHVAMQERYLEILDFTQFFDRFVFTPNAKNVLEKELKREIPVSVGIELVVVDMSRNVLKWSEFLETKMCRNSNDI